MRLSKCKVGQHFVYKNRMYVRPRLGREVAQPGRLQMWAVQADTGAVCLRQLGVNTEVQPVPEYLARMW